MIAHAASAQGQVFRGHATMPLMRLGHMFRHGGMAAPRAAAGMDGDAFVTVEDFDHAVYQPDIDLLANQAVRHRIEAAEHVDMVIPSQRGQHALRRALYPGNQCAHDAIADLAANLPPY